MADYTFKIVVCGNSGVGKSTFIKKHLTDEFEEEHIATQGVEIHTLWFDTSYGKVTFNMWDLAGSEKYSGMQDSYCIGADAALVFYSAKDEISSKTVNNWTREVETVAGKIPIVVCCNKVYKNYVRIPQVKNVGLQNIIAECFISVKKSYNIDMPFLYLAKHLTNKEDLVFMKNVYIKPVIQCKK